ncbi:prepilin peptidase, partial [Calditerricola satsumensis]
MQPALSGWTDDAAVLAWGLLFGSFLNVVAYRVPRGISVIWPPSACPHCGGRLAPRDLVPLFSYLW